MPDHLITPVYLKALLAGILLNRREPLAPHHINALRELLQYPTDYELRNIVNPKATTEKTAIVPKPQFPPPRTIREDLWP